MVTHHLVELLVHGRQFLPQFVSSELVQMVEGGGRVFADAATVISHASDKQHVTLWDDGDSSRLPLEIVCDLKSSEPGVMQDAIQDLADYCHGSERAERAEGVYRVLATAAAGDLDTIRLVRTVLREQTSIRTARSRDSSEPKWDVWKAPIVKMLPISAGSFVMGTNDGSEVAACPEHLCWLPTFWISEDPITRQVFLAFIEGTGYPFPLEFWSGYSDELQLPADYISYLDAEGFCLWLTRCHRARGLISEEEEFAVPTEAQWEKAARGVDGRAYPWGSTFESGRCNCQAGQLSRVGTHSPDGDSPYGVRDMAGNVCEWTSSLWGVGHREPQFGYPYFGGDGREADTIAANMRRVVRGGAYYYLPECVAGTTRNNKLPEARQRGTGFRIVRRAAVDGRRG